MKNFTPKFISLLMLLASFNISAQQITSDMFIPAQNTGANMTVGINVDVLDQFATGCDVDCQWGSVSSSGYDLDPQYITEGLIGAFYDLDGDGELECVGLEYIWDGFFALAIWGDDASTPEKDGLGSGESPQFAVLSNGTVFFLNVIPQFTGYVTNGITNITDAGLSGGSGCTDVSACNAMFMYSGVDYSDDGSCYFPEPWFDCDGLCINDIDSDGVCDELEILGCTDLTACNYNSNATESDQSYCEYADPEVGCNPGCTNEAYTEFDPEATSSLPSMCQTFWSDLYIASLDSISYLQDLVSQLQNDYDDAINYAEDLDEIWSYISSTLQEELDETYASLIDVTYQLETTQLALQTCLDTPQCEEIIIEIEEGWNIFGYTSAQGFNIADVMAPYEDKIYIIKDNNGDQYWPEYEFNGIGDFIPGGGYQIKAFEPFSISFEN